MTAADRDADGTLNGMLDDLRSLGGVVAANADRAHVWRAHGLWCATVPSPLIGVNGYVQLPELLAGVDTDALPAPGGITYGPDPAGWIGFDTGHGWDVWLDPDVPQSPMAALLADAGIELPASAHAQVWTIEKLRAACAQLAAHLRRIADAQR